MDSPLLNSCLRTTRTMAESSPRIWSKPLPLESRNAAFLLLKLKAVAANEVCGTYPLPCKKLTPLLIPQESCGSPESWHEEESDDSDVESSPSFSARVRTVSMCSSEMPQHPSLGIVGGISAHHNIVWTEIPSSPTELSCRNHVASVLSDVFSKPPSSKLVGTTAEAPVKGVLKRKFSWKSYPELEGYLISNREEYLQYSARLNYTADQKLYNNKLTQGLLDLASDQGYVFEDFTFSAIRDRIRCYYKSFVQAVKKKKRKKRA